jgi:hypothetical protein
MSKRVELIDCIPTELQGTTLGSMLATRIVQSNWQAISVDDIPEKWLATFHKNGCVIDSSKKFEDGCVIDSSITGCDIANDDSVIVGSIRFTMPDEPCCHMYMQWFTEQPTTKVNCMMESTQTFINEYGPDTYRRTLISLAVHGKPEAIFVQTAPMPAGWARPPTPPTSTKTRSEI